MRIPRAFEGFAIGILVLVTLVSAACTSARPAKFSKTAPDFTLKDPAGLPIRLSDYKGRVVLLNFWATWCGGCVLEVPWFVEFQERYKDNGLSVIGVSTDEDWQLVRRFVDEKKVNYPIVIDTEGVRRLYELNAMPMTLLIDRSGQIAASYIGVVDKGACESKLRTLLEDNTREAAE